MKQQPLSAEDEQLLMQTLWRPDVADDPVKFVLVNFPWGKQRTPLENHKGPRRWQIDQLRLIRDHIKNGIPAGEAVRRVLKAATSSGRGIGKSALTSWLALWMLSTRLGSTTILMANSEAQLKSRTMAEVRKWLSLARNGHWFESNAMSIRPAEWFAQLLTKEMGIDSGYYYIEAQLWSEENPDRVAGVHNHHGVMVIFDEASGIPESIWAVTTGFFTDECNDRYWLAFSNPRRNSGQFYECFHRDLQFWRTTCIDSREVEGTDKNFYQEIIDQHGEDSDVSRVEVKGQFPRTGSNQFIGTEVARLAADRTPFNDPFAPIVLGVDVARFGDDKSVIYTRKGRDAQTIPPLVFKGISTMELANRVATQIQRLNPDAVFIDGGGVGGGVIDRLKQMRFRVIEVNFGSSPYDKEKYRNKRAEMWGRMRDFLHDGGCLLNDPELISEMTVPEYSYDPQNRIVLEAKEDMKKRGYDSPDLADALALTFAEEVPGRDIRRRQQQNRTPRYAKMD